MGTALGFLVVAAVVAGVGLSIARSSRRRGRRQASLRTMAGVLGGAIGRQGHAEGVYGRCGVDAHLSRSSSGPSAPSSSSNYPQVDQLHLMIRSPSTGGGAWACERSPSLIPGRPAAIGFTTSPIAMLSGLGHLLGRLGTQPLDAAGQQRLAAAGLLQAVDALGQGVSSWLPRLSRLGAPDVGPELVSRLRGAGHETGGPEGGVIFNLTTELASPDVTAEQFRSVLDRVLRIVEIDVAVNR